MQTKGTEKMTEPNHDTSISPLAAIRCGNDKCERHSKEARTMCAVGKSWAELCTDYRPADHISDATKMVKCYNTDCDYYDTRYNGQCCAESTSPVCICAGYRPAETDTDAEKPTAQPPDAAFILRTERDQARAELAAVREVLRIVEWGGMWDMKNNHCPHCMQYPADGHSPKCTLAAAIAGHAEHPAVAELAKLRRTLELTGFTVPDIDEAVWEYSPAGVDVPGNWDDVWISHVGLWKPRVLNDRCLLMRRRRRVRRPPADADAITVPRRPCWVRNNADEDWIPATLLAVDETRFPKGPKFLIMREDGRTLRFNSCEIEVEA